MKNYSIILFGSVVILLLLGSAHVAFCGRIPAECYLDQRGGEINTCKYCHTKDARGSSKNDYGNQRGYPVSDNPYLNAVNPARLDTLVPPETIPEDLTEFLNYDNYHEALEARNGTEEIGSGEGIYKYLPDLDPDQVGPDGFANNGWRAFKWKPYELGWPRYLGRIQPNFIRLADKFRRNTSGEYDIEIYKANLDLLERVIKGEVSEGTYFGMAQDEEIIPFRYPAGTQLAHYLYYLDPSKPNMKAVRIKEARWNIKTVPEEAISPIWDREEEMKYALVEREGGQDAAYAYGMIYNSFGWDIIGFIEDTDGKLRPDTKEELEVCNGCHGRRLGVTVDSHYDLQRKLPGEAGWALQDYRGIPDYYNAKLNRGEMGEIYETYFGDASLLPGHPDGTINFLPTAEEADAFNRRYYQIVQTQSFALGRDPKIVNPGFFLTPPKGHIRTEEEVEFWDPALNFEAFDLIERATAIEERQSIVSSPVYFLLHQNYPNPFNPETAITYDVAKTGTVRLSVYALNGQLVRTLVDGEHPARSYSVTWDGRDGAGQDVASGVYMCRMVTDDYSAVRKMVLVR